MSSVKCAHHRVFFGSLVLFFLFFAVTAFPQETILLKVLLNGEDIGELFIMLAPDGDILIKRDDLRKTSLKEGLGKDVIISGDDYVSLRTIPDMTYSINEKEATLEVKAAPHLFKAQTVDASYKKSYEVYHPKDTSAFLNYGLFYNSENTTFDLTTEVGLHLRNYLLTSTFNYQRHESDDKLARLLTSIRTDDRKNMRTLIFGDFPAVSGVLGSAPLLGGINFSKNYDIDPYYVKYPSLTYSGALLYPSKAEIYVNDMLVKRETLFPGEFLFNDIPGEVGLGSTKIVIRDIFGTERVITRPFYYSDQLLKPGIQEYSYSFGFLRKDFGEKSFSYGDLAFLAFHNYGFTNSLKAGYSMELSRDVIQVGSTASVLLPKAGVLDLALTMSNSDGKTGLGGFLAHSFRSKYIDTVFSLTSLTRDYSNLTVKPSDDKPSLQYTGAIGLRHKDLGSIVTQYSATRFYTGSDTSGLFLSYNKMISKRATFFTTASWSEVEGSETKKELFCGLHIYFGRDISGLFSYTRGDGDNIKGATITKSLPVSSGFGFRADLENSNEHTDVAGDLSYQNDFGIYTLGYREFEEKDSFTASVSGGIGFIDGSLFLSRPLYESFAKVKVGDVEGVRIYSYGNEVTKTDRKGEAIIPAMLTFHDNRIDIENEDIPVDYSIPTLTQYINPSFRSGALVNFDIKKIQGVIGNIYLLVDGKKLPAELTMIYIHLRDRVIEGMVGRNGEFYFENIPSGKHTATVLYNGKECVFDIIIPDSREMMINLGEVVCELKKQRE
jgi:outer membrane usher protein